MGVFSSLNIGAQSLMLSQLALEVTGHNIANVNTEGYTRQRIEQKTGFPTNLGYGQIGTGAMLDRISRTTDEFIANQVAKESQLLSRRLRENDIYSRLEAIFNEPDENNLSTILGNFFESLNTLSTSPEDSAVRAMVKENGSVLAETLNSIYNQLEDIRTGIDAVVVLKVDDINNITAHLAELNEKIARAEVGGTFEANDYRDKRDSLVMELKEILAVTVVSDGTDSNGISVSIGGVPLVHRNYSYEIEAVLNSDNHYDILSTRDQTILNIQNGELKGYLEGRDVVIPAFQDEMDVLSLALIREINRVHSRGVGLTGFPTVTAENGVSSSTAKLNKAGFTFTPQDGSFYISVYDRDKNLIEQQQITVSAAADSLEDIRASIDAMVNVTATLDVNNKLTIAVNDINSGANFTFTDSNGTGDSSDLLLSLGINTFFTGTNSSDIAVNSVIENDLNKIAAAQRYSPGDNANAIDLVNLRGTLLMNNDTATFEDYYGTIVGEVGIQAQQSNNEYETSRDIVALLEQRWQETVGVSLDEEVINMIKYQRIYQASAKFVAGVDEMLSLLFNTM